MAKIPLQSSILCVVRPHSKPPLREPHRRVLLFTTTFQCRPEVARPTELNQIAVIT